jgi:hypothetical protein
MVHVTIRAIGGDEPGGDAKTADERPALVFFTARPGRGAKRPAGEHRADPAGVTKP